MTELSNKSILNNKIIILRKHLKSILNQTKLKLVKNIKKIKESKSLKNSAARKESELECFKRVRACDIPLALAVQTATLRKQLTDPNSAEIDRVFARVLLNQRIQETISKLTESYGKEFVENFLKSNEKNIQKHINEKVQKLSRKTANKAASSESEPDHDSEETKAGEVDLSQNNGSSKVLKKPKVVKQKNANSTASSTSNSNSKKNVAQPVKVRKAVDPFFVSSGGENYLASVQAASSCSSEDEDSREDRSDDKASKKLKNTQKVKTQLKTKNFKSKIIEPANRKESEPVKEKLVVKEKFSKSCLIPDLHPSWVAKTQMRQTQIQEFKGTKIKFDD